MPRNSNTPSDQTTQGRFDRDDGRDLQSRGQDDFGSGNRSAGQSGRDRSWSEDDGQRNQSGNDAANRSGNRQYDDGDDRSDDREDTQRGQYRGAAGGGKDHDEADYGAWHAYGHNRGYHGYQRRDNQTGGGTYGTANQGRFSDRDQHALAGNQGRAGDQIRQRGADYSQGNANAGQGRNQTNRDDDQR